jgi:phosphoenolpyruvate phosphomutase
MNDMNENNNPKLSKSAQLRKLLTSPVQEYLLEAHNGISARIVERAGFKGIWASGLALSAQFGVRDSNEASWTQVVDMLEFMSDVTSIPILLDGDTGYGNFNNMRRLVRKLEQRNIAGVCIEDKQFPKTNSFLNKDRQALADIDEFCGKIKAGKDSQTDEDFCIIARIEALIAGWGMEEALRRAEAYHAAGADALLIHSKRSDSGEIVSFAERWGNQCPIVIVPTSYYSTPQEVYKKSGISLVIWANHMIRAAVSAMEDVSKQIFENTTILDVEDRIASMKEIFSLQGTDELEYASEKYLTQKSTVSAIILAASRGNEFQDLTLDRPKVMLKLNGIPLLQRLVTEFKNQSVNNISVVAGYKSEAIDVDGISLLINKDYENTGELVSLTCAQDAFQDDMIVLYGDLLFRSYVLRDLLDTQGDIVIVVDSKLPVSHVSGMPDFVYCNKEDDRSLFKQEVELTGVSENQQLDSGEPSGRWTGIMRGKKEGRKWLEEALKDLCTQGDFSKLTVPDLLNHLIKTGRTINVHYINGHWLDVNELADIERAGDFIQRTGKS